MAQVADPDDIFRVIDEDKEDQRNAEFNRLIPKLRALKSHFSGAWNVLANLIQTTRGQDNNFDRSAGTQKAIDRAREKLEQRFEKLERCYNRMLALQHDEQAAGRVEADLKGTQDKYANAIQALGQLMIEMLPQKATQEVPAGGAAQNLKPIEALKPSFTLSFDNSPTELAAWMAQFKAYYEASRLHVLPVQQQQAFLRQGLDPDLWIAIQQKLDMTTRIFKNALELDEDSCEKFIEDTFQVRYPLIMRRYRFFTYERRGNQTFTNFYGKLIELANTAQLENMGQNEYLMFRIIAGINDPPSVDKLLSIPQAEFNLEEVHRVAVACEAAKNYSGLNNKSVDISCKVSGKKSFYNRPTPDPGKGNNKSPNGHPQNQDMHNENDTHHDHRTLSGSAKIKFLRENGKCVRCGYDKHPTDTPCPFLNTPCHKCGTIGHISPVCAKE